jgi:hypothetical protein
MVECILWEKVEDTKASTEKCQTDYLSRYAYTD